MKLTIAILMLTLFACRSEPQRQQKKDPVEVPTANATHMRYCEEGAPGSCLMMGVRYERGEDVNQDVDKAFEYYEKACKLGSSHGCYSKALILMHERENPIQALSFLEFGCDQQRHGPSCVVLGDMARDGVIYAASEEAALKRYGEACTTGYHRGCNAYIRHVWTASKQLIGLNDFVEFLESNCEAGHDMSCNEAADIHLMGAEWGGEVLHADRKKAEEFHAKLASARRTRVLVDKQTAPPPQEMPIRDVTPPPDGKAFEAGAMVITGREGAAIAVDGVDTGKVSPATVAIFTGGKHTVQLRDKDGKVSREKLTWIDSGGRVELHFE